MAGKAGYQDIARRYSLAFFELSKEGREIDSISKDLESVKKMLEMEDFQSFIENMTLRREDQAKAIVALCKKAKFNDLTKKFLGTLAEKRRLNVLPEIIFALEKQIADHRGEVTAEVTAARTLDAKQVTTIAEALRKILGKTVKVELKQDASIMGGLIIRVGSHLIDNSVSSKLERLHRSLKSSSSSSDNTNMREVA